MALPRFYCDSMLGKLARWLLLLGFDTRWAGVDGRPDAALLEEAKAEGRVFVTRDRKIPKVAGLGMVVLRPEGLERQLEDLLEAVGARIDEKELFTRCTSCNVPFEPLAREEALALVPPLVRELDTPFYRCPRCRKVFWLGTHTARVLAKLRRMR